jgi:hypothetical protein
MSGIHTALSPEWDRGFDAAFAELISADDDLVRAEFTELTQAAGVWTGGTRPAGAAAQPSRHSSVDRCEPACGPISNMPPSTTQDAPVT